YNGVSAPGGYRIDVLPPGDFCYNDANGEGVCSDKTVYQVNAALTSPLLPTASKYLNWFAQDSWELTPVLNLALGIRWERQEIKGDATGATGVTFDNNWAPRIGITYDYRNNGNSKLFFHYGRFFEKLPNNLAIAFDPGVYSNSYFLDPDLSQPFPDFPGD